MDVGASTGFSYVSPLDLLPYMTSIGLWRSSSFAFESKSLEHVLKLLDSNRVPWKWTPGIFFPCFSPCLSVFLFVFSFFYGVRLDATTLRSFHFFVLYSLWIRSSTSVSSLTLSTNSSWAPFLFFTLSHYFGNLHNT